MEVLLEYGQKGGRGGCWETEKSNVVLCASLIAAPAYSNDVYDNLLTSLMDYFLKISVVFRRGDPKITE